METLIKEIIAAELPITTLVKTMNLVPEQGSISISLNNLNKILKSPLKFKVSKVTFVYNERHSLLKTEWVSKDNDFLTWDFRGFSAGDEQEKSKGLVKALKLLSIKDWDLKTVSELQPDKYNIT